jgi:Aldehyde dehydrogenase family
MGRFRHRSGTLRHDAAEALTDTGISAEVAPGQWFSTYAEPAGVAGIIVPWNAPVALLIRSLAPALAAGNTVAVKMPGQTALAANLVSQIIAEVTRPTPSHAPTPPNTAWRPARSPSRTSRKPRPSTPFRRSRADQPHHA